MTEDITVSVNTLARNFEKTLAIVEEMLLKPRWDSLSFELARTRILNGIRRSSIDPTYLGSMALSKLTFGGDNIFSTDVSGTPESVQSMTMDDIKAFYEKNISPSVARFLVVGSVDQARVEKALASPSRKLERQRGSDASGHFPHPHLKKQEYISSMCPAPNSPTSILEPLHSSWQS